MVVTTPAAITVGKANEKAPAIKIVPIAISIGNRPLQGTKLLVRIAINVPGRIDYPAGNDPRRHYIPKPMHIVRACCRKLRILKALSRLKATGVDNLGPLKA